MSYQKLLQQMIGMTLVLLLLVGCGTPAATPVPPTATPVPPTATPAASPIPVQTAVLTATLACLLPTTPPTPASAPGAAHAKEYQVVQAYQDFWVGKTAWGFWLHKGEKGFLDKDGKVLEIQDAQGRVKLENLGDDRFRFYAWEDGYDERVGSGYLLLKAGYSYTFAWSAEHGNQKQVEVRVISNDQLLGYALLIETYNSNYQFTGFEKPIATVDKSGDGLVSIQELDAALAGLRAQIAVTAKSKPALAARFEADIASACAAINSGAIADAYQKIKQLQLESAAAVP